MSGLDAIVVGAGVVGVCSALHLQRAGLAVALFDPAAPGEACSYGNAGMLGSASCVPMALPGVLAKVPRMLMPDGPLAIEWRSLPAFTPWLMRFAASARRSRVERIADAMNALQSRLLEHHLELAEAAGARELIRPAGKLHLWQSAAGRAADAYPVELMRSRGHRHEELSADEVRQLEPALTREVHGALLFEQIHHVVDPLALVQAYLAAFEAAGGRLHREAVQTIEPGSGTVTVRTEAGEHRAGLAVLAAGVWSGALARRLGVRSALLPMRGYHVMFLDSGVELRRPVNWRERSLYSTPMRRGIRVSGFGELARIDAPAVESRWRYLIDTARSLLPGLETARTETWMGQRPSTPDSLPIIGRAPASERVILAFGHGHWGLGQGAVTGRLVADLALRRPPAVDLTPYRPERF